MTLEYLQYLVDPTTGESLRLENARTVDGLIYEGVLVSSTSSYPIIRGIPRFVPLEKDNYARTFGYQWKKWPRVQFEKENIGRPMEGHTTRMWERITGITNAPQASSDSKEVLVDIGCGPGRFSDVALEKGYAVIAVDYSGAVEAARDNFPGNKNICVIQADALKLPIKKGSMAGAFSIGVLHHTPDPLKGVQQAYDVLRPDGWFAISVYGKGGYYDFPQVQLWRRTFKALWPAFGPYPALLYSYLCIALFWPICRVASPIGKAIRLFIPFVNLADYRWSLLDTFDSLTPSYQSAHTSYEIYLWLKNLGFRGIEPTDWGFTAYRGMK